jgi:hypothetical protein
LSLYKNEIKWKTVDGGSRQYVDKMIGEIGKNTFLNTPVKKVLRKKDGCEVHLGGSLGKMSFDKVILSCNGPETLKIIGDCSKEERSILGMFKTSKNKVILHGDASHMPQRKKVWSSWNFITDNLQDSLNEPIEVTYWMNRLQSIKSSKQVFVTLNPSKEIAPQNTFYKTSYSHPVFDSNTPRAQELLKGIQGENNLFYAGAKMGFGFHEDGLNSGLNVAKSLQCVPNWSVKEK